MKQLTYVIRYREYVLTRRIGENWCSIKELMALVMLMLVNNSDEVDTIIVKMIKNGIHFWEIPQEKGVLLFPLLLLTFASLLPIFFLVPEIKVIVIIAMTMKMIITVIMIVMILKIMMMIAI